MVDETRLTELWGFARETWPSKPETLCSCRSLRLAPVPSAACFCHQEYRLTPGSTRGRNPMPSNRANGAARGPEHDWDPE